MKRIARLRKEKGLNQTGLGMKLNLSQKMISSYENGIHQPGVDTLIEMSKLFGVSVDYIIGNSDVRLKADYLCTDKFSERDIRLLDMFKSLSDKKKEQAFGIIFALSRMDK